MILMLEAALRGLTLGLAIWVLLRLIRFADVRTEAVIWTQVLLAALAMPWLMPLFARWLPAVPALAWPASVAAAPAAPSIGVMLVAPDGPAAPAAGIDWLAAHAGLLAWSIYGAVALLGVARLATGLILVTRLYRAAMPVQAAWTEGWSVRASARIASPRTFGRCILLPADHAAWAPAKRAAVLAHERSHVARGDFFVLLLAALYRALFWFSPFAWWLQAHLSALAERASDEAAIRRIQDRAGYAEILIEVSRHAEIAGPIPQVAMAGGPDIAWRIHHVLDDAATPPDGRKRIVALAAILPALALAGTHATGAPAAAQALRLPILRMAAGPAPTPRPAEATTPATPAPRPRQRKAVAPAPLSVAAAAPEPEVTYNPRALLETPVAIAVPAVIVLNR